MNIIGAVAGKDCLLIDDIVDSGGTLCNAADALLANGATSVTAYITHDQPAASFQFAALRQLL